MFDKRIFELAPGVLRHIVGNVVCKWAALLARVLLVIELSRVIGACVAGQASWIEPAGFAGFALACIVVAFAGEALSRRCGSQAGALAAREARKALYGKLVRLGPSFTEKTSVAEASTLLGDGVERLRPYVSAYLPQLFFAVIAPLTLFCFLAPRDLPVAIVLLVCVPLMPVCIIVLMKGAKRAMGEYWDTYVDLGGMFSEAVRALTTLKIYQADAAKHEQMNEAAEGFRATTMRLLRTQLNSVTIMDFFTYAGSALGCILVLFQCAGGALSFGDAFAIVVLSLEFFLPMRRFGSLFHTGMGAGTVIGQVCDLLGAEEPARGTKEVNADWLDLVCEDVGYAYGGAGDEGGREALSSVSLKADPGSYVGITGESGSGKSTLGKVLTGRYTGYTGSVRLGGVELRELAPEALHACVTLVSSESHVFQGTLRSNLELGNPDATDADMWKALHECHLDTFAVSVGGLDAPVTEGGGNLSGGERQRLRAARALLHDTPIYVFDEATANIDAESEKAILDFIQELSMRKTVIVISHRLKCLVWTDDIYVLDSGRVAQEGEHASLVAQPGPYQVLWQQQQGLEEFARQTEGVVEAEIAVESRKDESLNKLIANMPDKIASVVKASYEAKPIAEMITGKKRKSKHPSWIPLTDEQRAELEALEAEDGEGDEGGEGAPAVRPADSSAQAAGGRGALAIVRGLMRVTRERWGLLARATALGVLAALSAIAIPVLATWGLLAGLGLVGSPGIVPLACAMAACGIVRGFLRYGERLCTHDQTFRTLALLRDKCFGAMRRLAPAKLEERDSGDLVSLLTTDIELLEMFYSRTLSPVMVSLFVMVVACVAIAALSPAMGLVALVGYVLVGVVLPLATTHVLQARGRETRERAVVMGSFMTESLHGLAEILQFGWGDAAEDDGGIGEKMGDGAAGPRSGELLGALGPALVLLFDAALALVGLLLVAGGTLAPWAAALALAVFLASTDAATSVSNLGATLQQTLAAGERVLDLLDEEPQTPEVADGVDLDGFTGLVMRDVDFSYGGEQVLNHVNIEVPEGAVVRLSGPSGTGKSTIVKLVMRFFDVGAGSIEISGHDIREVNTASLRAIEGYMTQDSYLFEGTLRENLSFAKPSASDEELMAALDKAALGRFARALPDGLDTRFTSENAGLSDGERQRLGLARMFLHDAPFFILDEPTSNLDALNEAAILRSLAENGEGKTMLIVSHRPSIGVISDITYTTRRTTPELTMGRYL